MRNKLPAPDTKAEYTHVDFDGLLKQFQFPNNTGLSTKVVLSAETRGSDIKWNDMAGKLTMQVFQGEKLVANLFDCELTHFTGNCGVKAISHLYFGATSGQPAVYSELLKLIESFAYHRTNCGWLIGSDTEHGNTWKHIKTYGTGYKNSGLTWNPNYTWSRDHKIVTYWKDLNEVKHTDYWKQAQASAVDMANVQMTLNATPSI